VKLRKLILQYQFSLNVILHAFNRMAEIYDGGLILLHRVLDSATNRERREEEICRRMISRLRKGTPKRCSASGYGTEIGSCRKTREGWSEIANRRKQDHSYACDVTIDHPSPAASQRSSDRQNQIMRDPIPLPLAYRSSLHRFKLIRGLKVNQHARALRARKHIPRSTCQIRNKAVEAASFTRIIASLRQ